MPMEILLYILAGAAVGLAIGITGVGGGSLMTPLLIMFGIPYQVAIGTDLLYAGITKAGGVISHHRMGSINWRVVRLLAAGSLPASLVTVYFLDNIFNGATDYKELLTSSLGVMLMITAAVILFKSRIQNTAAHETAENWLQQYKSSLTFFMGLLLGIFVTLSSVGAGAIGSAILLMLYPRLAALHIVGTDIAHAVPLTLIAGFAHFILLGNVDIQLLVCLLIGSLPAVTIGAKLGANLPNNILQPILAIILLILGVKFVLL